MSETKCIVALPEKEDSGDVVAGALVEINKKSYQARLGLARVLAKQPGCTEESCRYYNQVIDMAPQVREAPFKSHAKYYALCPRCITDSVIMPLFIAPKMLAARG